MVAILDPGPMRPAEVDPILWRTLWGFLTGQVVALLGGGQAGFLVGALAVNANDTATAGEAGSQRLGLTKAYSPFFDATVPTGGLDKRGVSGVRVRAYSSSVGWLPLICRK